MGHTMKTIANEKLVFVDVDDTLILWNSTGKGHAIEFVDPYSNEIISVYKHDNNIRLLKEKYSRGYTVIVWSQGGYAHARAVVRALGLAKYVTLCMSKPTAYIDDKSVCEWMQNRVWLDPKSRYKDEQKKT